MRGCRWLQLGNRMKRGKLIALFQSGTRTAVIGLMLIAFPYSSTNAQQHPREGCRAVSKIEYDSAKRQYLLHGRFGSYVRTGHFWRHYYWYCH
jgi:hypothetical protein